MNIADKTCNHCSIFVLSNATLEGSARNSQYICGITFPTHVFIDFRDRYPINMALKVLQCLTSWSRLFSASITCLGQKTRFVLSFFSVLAEVVGIGCQLE